MEKMDVWLTEKVSSQEPANSLDLHLRISLNTFQVHLSYIEQTKKTMSSFMQTTNFFI